MWALIILFMISHISFIFLSLQITVLSYRLFIVSPWSGKDFRVFTRFTCLTGVTVYTDTLPATNAVFTHIIFTRITGAINDGWKYQTMYGFRHTWKWHLIDVSPFIYTSRNTGVVIMNPQLDKHLMYLFIWT